MRITICGLGFELTDAIVQHVEGRIKLSFATILDRIDTVSVRLSDINGTRGGIDKRCRMVIDLHHLRTIVVEAVDADLYTAVDEAASRARETLRRCISRRRTLHRQFANRSLHL